MKRILFWICFGCVFFWIGAELVVAVGKKAPDGYDRILHPYLAIGGFHRGGYWSSNIAPNETPEASGYFKQGIFGIPTFAFGTPVKSITDRGQFLYRDRAHVVDKPKAKDEIRVFILGGSVAFGEGAIKPENRWFIKLEEILRQRTRKNYVVVPAANHSHVTTQERIILDLYVLPHQPDILIFLDGFNDANTGISATRPGDPYGMSIIYKHDQSPLFGFLTDVSKHSPFLRYLMLKELMDAWHKPFAQAEYDQQAASVSSVYYDNLSHMNRRCHLEKLKCLFLLQPYWQLTLSNRGAQENNHFDMIATNYKKLREDIKKYPFMTDLTGVFDDPKIAVPFYDQAHFRDDGHLYIAEKIADMVLKK